MGLRETILAEIKRIAEASGGRAPGAGLFRTETGIPEHKWRGVFWARWSDALAEAGFGANAWTSKLDSNTLLRKLAEIVRERRRLPTYAELQIMRRTDGSVPSPKTLQGHFNNQQDLVRALRSFCGDHSDLATVPAFLPETAEDRSAPTSRLIEGWVYLLHSGQHYKIGRSDQLETRVKKIAIALPEATTLVHAIKTDDPPGIEAYWHRRFDDRRANGEWFKLSAADVAAFVRRKFQ